MSARSGQARVRNDEVKYKAVESPLLFVLRRTTRRKYWKEGRSLGELAGEEGALAGERPLTEACVGRVWAGEGTSAAMDPLCAGLRAWEMQSGGRRDLK